jgi:hypothetical protein
MQHAMLLHQQRRNGVHNYSGVTYAHVRVCVCNAFIHPSSVAANAHHNFSLV